MSRWIRYYYSTLMDSHTLSLRLIWDGPEPLKHCQLPQREKLAQILDRQEIGHWQLYQGKRWLKSRKSESGNFKKQ